MKKKTRYSHRHKPAGVRAPSLLVGARGRFTTHQATNTSQGAPPDRKWEAALGPGPLRPSAGCSLLGILGAVGVAVGGWSERTRMAPKPRNKPKTRAAPSVYANWAQKNAARGCSVAVLPQSACDQARRVGELRPPIRAGTCTHAEKHRTDSRTSAQRHHYHHVHDISQAHAGYHGNQGCGGRTKGVKNEMNLP